MHINQESQKVSEGYTVYLPPNAVQYVENLGGKELECTLAAC